MTNSEETETLAAEYVLGTLEADERAQVRLQRHADAALDEAITGWEQQLAPLLARVDEARPRAALLKEIQDSIAAEQILPKARVLNLHKQVRLWKSATVGAAAIAASLLMMVVTTAVNTPPEEQDFVAVFQDGDQLPRFIMSINLAKRELTIKPVAAALPEGKTFQLWIKSDELGPAPQSLGLVASHEQPSQKGLNQFAPGLLMKATFGISIEPEGGSPTGKPSAGALHSQLIPAVF